ncbi:MAG TPA: MBL fold metallo-hydrolase [Candidatus Nanopelagicales bacterium]|nr:MBL fold metallo-hydrolase [Candidatus Nanopelagicales bacterium]
MLVVGFPAGPWGTNCYLVAAGAGEQCVIVDPGKDSMPGIEQMLQEHRLSPVAVLLTHGHIDHVWSVVPVCGARDIPAYLHPDDRWQMAAAYERILASTDDAIADLTAGALTVSEPDDLRELSDGVELELAGLTLTVDHAPGHTQGSVMFRRAGDADVPPLLLSGDVLFEGSIGRTDLPGGDHPAMLRSLREKVLPLDDSTVVLPGHGGTTTIAREREENPYLTALAGEAPAPTAPRRGM